jgi:hypothetical protein
LVTFSSCDSSSDETVTPEDVQAYFAENSRAGLVMFDGLNRLLAAANGIPVEGVLLDPDGNTVDAILALDFDGDGVRETNVVGGVVFPNAQMSFDTGATVEIREISGSNVDGTASATARTIGGGAVSLNGSGEFNGKSGPTVEVEFGATVVPEVNSVVGSADITAGDFQATGFWEDNGLGGTQIRFVGDDFEFTIGDAYKRRVDN